MNYVLNEALKRKKYSEPDLFAPGEPCKCKCSDDCVKVGCKDCREVRKDCKIHAKNEAYETLTTGMIGGPSIVFCRYAEAGVSQIRSHIYSDSEAGATAKPERQRSWSKPSSERAQKLAERFSVLMLIPFTCFVLDRKCLAERKKFFQLTQKRKTN